MAKKYSEVEELRQMLESRREQFDDLEKEKLQSDDQRLRAAQSLLTRRDELIAHIRLVEEWVRILGYDPTVPTGNERLR